MNERFARLGHNKDSKITIELDQIEAMILTTIIASNMEDLKKQNSLDSICKLLFLQQIGKKVVDQIVPEEKQSDLMAEMLLKAMEEEGRQHYS